MKIEEAIETTQKLLDGKPTESISNRRDALKLGIEALKRIQSIRECDPRHRINLLPGETTEAETAQEVKHDKR